MYCPFTSSPVFVALTRQGPSQQIVRDDTHGTFPLPRPPPRPTNVGEFPSSSRPEGTARCKSRVIYGAYVAARKLSADDACGRSRHREGVMYVKNNVGWLGSRVTPLPPRVAPTGGRGARDGGGRGGLRPPDRNTAICRPPIPPPLLLLLLPRSRTPSSRKTITDMRRLMNEIVNWGGGGGGRLR